MAGFDLFAMTSRYEACSYAMIEAAALGLPIVTTDIRGGMSGRLKDGNSIFIFEVAGLCIGHLGHLHQIPNDEQYAAIGRLDVVMVPVESLHRLPGAGAGTVRHRGGEILWGQPDRAQALWTAS